MFGRLIGGRHGRHNQKPAATLNPPKGIPEKKSRKIVFAAWAATKQSLVYPRTSEMSW
jgi:hypothetical protein